MLEKNILRLADAAELLGLSKSHLYLLTSKGKIPFYKPCGKIIYFRKDELEEWMLQNRHATSTELDRKATAYVVENERR